MMWPSHVPAPTRYLHVVTTRVGEFMPWFCAFTKALDEFPVCYRTWHQETAHPFRRTERAIVVRVPLTERALVAGVWERRLADEDEAFAAIGFHPTPYLEQENVA